MPSTSPISLGIPNAPTIPTLPEISVARRDAREAAAKIAAFAYDRETREPIWQSGIRHSLATAKDTWFMGIGPFQGGSIRKKTKLAGNNIQFSFGGGSDEREDSFARPKVDFTAETRFDQGWPEGSEPPPVPEPTPPPPVEGPEVQIAEAPDKTVKK